MQLLFKSYPKLLTLCLLISLVSTSCNKTDDKPVVEEKGIACFEMSNTAPIEGETVTFDAFCSKHATNYYWYIDDREVPSDDHLDLEISKSFYAGNHKVKLRTTGPKGNDEVTKEFVVASKPGPTACFRIEDETSDNRYKINSYIEFNANCSSGDIAQYYWTFGTNGPYSSSSPSIRQLFDEVGTYEVTVTVIANSSSVQGDSYSKTITIVE